MTPDNPRTSSEAGKSGSPTAMCWPLAEDRHSERRGTNDRQSPWARLYPKVMPVWDRAEGERMTHSRTERDRPHWSGVLSLMLLILLILWLTGNLKHAPTVIAPGLDFNQSQPERTVRVGYSSCVPPPQCDSGLGEAATVFSISETNAQSRSIGSLPRLRRVAISSAWLF